MNTDKKKLKSETTATTIATEVCTRLCVMVLFLAFGASMAQADQQQDRSRASALYNRGMQAYRSGDAASAYDAWSKALTIFKTIKDTKRNQANCYMVIGNALKRMGKSEDAIRRYEQALTIYKTIKGTERNQAQCYGNIGNVLENMSKYEESIRRQKQALSLFKTIKGTELDQAKCSMGIGVALKGMGKHEESIRRQKQALSLLKTIKGTERNQATCFGNIGVVLESMGKYEEGVRRQNQALAIYKTIKGTEWAQSTCYRNIGVALWRMGKYEEAIQRHEQALAIYKTIKGTERGQSACYQNIGVPLGYMGKYEEAIRRQEMVLAILKTRKGTERGQGACYQNMGVALLSMGKYKEALRRQEQALTLFKTIKGAERSQAACFVNIGVALWSMGKYGEAIRRHEQALTIYKTIKGTERERAGCYKNIGLALNYMGKYKEAVQRLKQALTIYKTIKGTERDQAGCWGNLGETHRVAGRFSEAIAAYENSGSNWWISRGMGLAYSQRRQPGDDRKAVGHFIKAVRSAERMRSSVLASEHRAGIFVEPCRVFRDFVGFLAALDRKKGNRKEQALVQWTVGYKLESVALTAAFHYADRGKGRSLEDALREKSALKTTRADTMLLAEDRKLSLRISKLTSLREPLPKSDTKRRKKLSADIESLQQQRNMIEVKLKKTALGGYVAPDFRKPMEMAKELGLNTAVLQYSVGDKKGWLLIMMRGGITAHRLGADTPALPELLPRHEATLGRLVKAWKARADKIGMDGLVRLARARAEDLGKRARERKNLLGANHEKAVLERLAAVVLPDAAMAQLRKKGIRRLLIIPDGSLHYIPFAMLRLKNKKGAGSHYLVEEFSSSYIPAMTTLDTIRKQRRQRRKKRLMQRRPLLAFANPAYGTGAVPALRAKDDMLTRVRAFRSDYYKGGGLRLTSLPETEREAVRVASLFAAPKTYSKLVTEEPIGRAVVFTGHGASERQAKKLLVASDNSKTCRQWQYVLFSTHGLADTYNGMLSCLALSAPPSDSTEDGFLQAQEVMNLRLDADLVMLSACQTGLGRLRGGEGLVGLSAAFFYAGTQSVCASLWQVPSGPTSQLVPELFKRLKEDKTDRAEALRQAQLQVLRKGRGLYGKPADYSSPFCWAAFILMGEYKVTVEPGAGTR